MTEGLTLHGSLGRGDDIYNTGQHGSPLLSSPWQSLAYSPHPRERVFLRSRRVDRDGLEAWEERVWGSEDSNLRRCCEAFLSEHFQACCCSRYQVLLRRVLGPLGLQGRPRAGGEGEMGGRKREKEQERRDTQSL